MFSEVFVVVADFFKVPGDDVKEAGFGGVRVPFFVEDALAEVGELVVLFFKVEEGEKVFLFSFTEEFVQLFALLEGDEKGAAKEGVSFFVYFLGDCAKGECFWGGVDDGKADEEVANEFGNKVCLCGVVKGEFDSVVSLFVKGGEEPASGAFVYKAKVCLGGFACAGVFRVDFDAAAVFFNVNFAALLDAPRARPLAGERDDVGSFAKLDDFSAHIRKSISALLMGFIRNLRASHLMCALGF